MTDDVGAGDALRARLRSAELAAAVGHRLIASAVQPDGSIPWALEELGVYAEAQRAYVFLLSDDGGSLADAYEWTAEGVEGHDFDAFRGVSVEAFPWSMAQFLEGETVIVADPDALPPEADPERGACEALSIRTYVNMPLFSDGRLIGWLGFDAVEAPVTWTDAQLQLMRVCGDLLADHIERRRQDERVFREQELTRRIASLGTLAAGLAHEINNPLTAVVGNVVVLQEMLAAGTLDTAQRVQAAQILSEVAEASDRIRRVVDDLRTFTRGDDGPQRGVDLVEVLDKTLRIAGHRIRHAARLERDYADASPVAGSFSQLGQVFLNLIMNAVHAIGDGAADANQITVRAWDIDDRVRIEFSDTGRGMTEHVQSRIFDPFFTTREVGEGMGVGLTICHRVVTTLGGTISVRSQPEVGSTFTIELPRTERASAATAPTPEPEAPRALRVLAIDDEAFVVRTLQRQLAHHEVVAVSDGHAAVELLAADDAFDVVFCDVMMPVSSGLKVFAHVQAHHPHLVDRFVFLTAGAFGQTVDSALEETGRPLVHKPFTRAQLEQHLPTR